jgi:hypothetical protein
MPLLHGSIILKVTTTARPGRIIGILFMGRVDLPSGGQSMEI